MSTLAAASPIPRQVRLPLRIALDVVLQGIRIRFGRSVVTVTGVVCGIAFLMSILTGQALKRGVSREDDLRAEVDRMGSILLAETGPARDRTFALRLAGPLAENEQRLVLRLVNDGAAALTVTASDQLALLPAAARARAEVRPPVEHVREASALLILGTDLPGENWAATLAGARQPVVAWTRGGDPSETTGVRFARLGVAPSEELLARQAAAAKREQFRSVWIVVISLLVTVMGISNAMLMSVTERFREIGTMKCLGALSSFVRTMFLIESGIMGLIGGVAGCLGGALFAFVLYGFTYGFPLMLAALGGAWLPILGAGALSILAGLGLSVLAALYPAQVASNMVPATALRSNV